ncbi:glycoside hydrolase family 32 protein [Amphibacillus sediminis]|uniref:glycoside hydrolase family 32 protein n=1 Tax=Amphibacillus sediminis TaxID=360185 RepID=UPI000835E2BE|nr:glycoside hydrolase family 32 protein [Amphibacillus sediminis]
MLIKEKEQYRPRVHFAPQANWINDPNGMVYFEGEYHLFYQYNPNDTVWGPMHWGHAVSKDMVKWEELSIALYPDQLGQIFSGSAVVDWDNTTGFFPEKPGLVAIFTHHQPGDHEHPDKQSQSIAYSHDRGRTWEKYHGNPVLTDDTLIDFRDPKVFWDQTRGLWIMVLATGQSVRFYSSKNLKEWQFESQFGDDRGYQKGVWECPDLFQLPVEGSDKTRWVLLVSVGDNPEYQTGSKTQYFVGEFDGKTFKPEHVDVRWLDHGKDNYAGVSFSDIPSNDGRRIYMGWMSNWRYANQVPTKGWRGQMTFPRCLSLQEHHGQCMIRQLPVKEIERYARQVSMIDRKRIEPSQPYHIKLDEGCVDVKLKLDIARAQLLILTCKHTADQETIITFNGSTQEVSLQRQDYSHGKLPDLFEATQSMPFYGNPELNIRLIIDAASIELFTDDGLQALTSLIYPDQPCQELVITSQNGDTQLLSGQVSIL